MNYTEKLPPERLAVRRDEAAMMISNGKIVDEWISSGQLVPCNPGDHIPIYDVGEIKVLFRRWTFERRQKKPSRDAEYQRQQARAARNVARQ